MKRRSGYRSKARSVPWGIVALALVAGCGDGEDEAAADVPAAGTADPVIAAGSPAPALPPGDPGVGAPSATAGSAGEAPAAVPGDPVAPTADPVPPGDAPEPPTGSDPAEPTPPDAPVPPAGRDPGTAPWVPVAPDQVASVCGLDPDLLAAADAAVGKSYVVVRYGKLCHEFYAPGEAQQGDSTHVFSASKTLAATVFGIAVYQTRELPVTGPRTGPLSDLDRMDAWIDPATITFNPDAHVAHVLAMVGFNADLSHGQKQFQYDADGSREIQRLADVAQTAISQDAARLGTSLGQFAIDFLMTPLGMQASTWSAFAGPPPMAYGWNATLRDMARLGVLLIHEGTYDGQRVLGADWVYKMTHPAFEDASTGYGYLTWLGASCAPAPRWQSYPHGLSEATDCGSPFGCAAQDHDVGVWQASGLGGQYIQGHKGLDLVLAVKDYDPASASDLWAAVRPALVALDPTYAGDESAFCSAYQSGSYAPDLM